MLKKALMQGVYVALLYCLVLLVNNIFHLTNIKVTDTDFFFDMLKAKTKFNANKLLLHPLYVIAIDDNDVKKYKINGYALSKSLISGILQRYEQSDASILFLDLDISKYSCIDAQQATPSDNMLVSAINHLSKKILLPYLHNAPLYQELNNTNISYVSVDFQANGERQVDSYLLQENSIPSVAYTIYKEIDTEAENILTKSLWIDKRLSTLIVFKDFDGENSYYSGLSRLSLDQFLHSQNDFSDAVILVGRVDHDAHDSFDTPIGVINGIYLHANSVMSMFYYGKIKSYHLLNLLLAFILGFLFSLIFELLKSKMNLSETKEDMLASIGVMIFLFLCAGLSYILLEYYSIFLDYQKVIFVFGAYEAVKIIANSSLIRRMR